MKKRFIFSTITLGLFTLFGLGCFACISNNAAKETKASEITTQPIKKYKKISLTIDYFDKDILLYFRAKNYSNNGNGTFYNGDYIGIDTSSHFPIVTTTTQYVSNARITLLNGNSTTQVYLTFEAGLYQGVSTLSRIYLSGAGQFNDLYKVYNTQPPSGIFNRDHCAFVVKRLAGGNSDHTDFVTCVNAYFDVYEIGEDIFTFNGFNPYYLNNVNYSENPYVVYTNLVQTISIEPFFVSGYAFDSIKLIYADATNTTFKIGSNYLNTTFGSGQYMYYMAMAYYNSATNFTYTINRQEVLYGTNGNDSYSVVVGSNVWVAENLKTIRFFTKPNQTTINLLENLTNNSQIGGFDIAYDNNVSLNGAFSLLSMAFASWLPILSISVLPGITLGMLIFLPLIVGIVILIIWIVKR